MNVLMLGWELPPHHTGGMGVVCLQLCKALSKQNVDIEFILPFTADFPEIDFMKIKEYSCEPYFCLWFALKNFLSFKKKRIL